MVFLGTKITGKSQSRKTRPTIMTNSTLNPKGMVKSPHVKGTSKNHEGRPLFNLLSPKHVVKKQVYKI